MIRKIEPEEFERLTLHGRGRSSPFYNAVLALKVGEALVIEKKDWKAKYSPTIVVNRVAKKHGYKYLCGALPDRSGWAVKRVK